MKKKKLYVIITILLSFIISFLLTKKNDKNYTLSDIKNKTTNKDEISHLKSQKNLLEVVTSLYKNPINLYGKVIDQHQKPVSDATIKLYPLTSHISQDSSNQLTLKTDPNGGFSITGLRGYSMGVTANKKGYICFPPTSDLSSQAYLYYSQDGYGRRHATPSNPLILELFRVSDAEPLIYVRDKNWNLPVDGCPRSIALDTENGTGTHQIEFRFLSGWNQLPMDNEINSKLYNWSFEMRIPGGGFVWDKSDAEFEAPESGYKEVVRYEYSADMPREKWQRLRFGRYFVKFADGTYGRIQFDIDGSSDWSPLSMQSWLSLKPNNRNLATEQMTIKELDSKEPEN